MTMNIVLRAGDPARMAEIARALGFQLLDPNRPNPDLWHMRGSVSVVVTSTEKGPPGIYVGPDKFEGALVALADLLGPEALVVGADANMVGVCGPDGMRVTIERDAPAVTPFYDFDVGSLFTVAPMIKDNRKRILEEMHAAGASNPRLVGNVLGRMKGRQRWLLVVDADEDADLQPFQDWLRSIQDFWAPVEVRRAMSFDPDRLAEIDRMAFDI